jgi:hypothetical protein
MISQSMMVRFVVRPMASVESVNVMHPLRFRAVFQARVPADCRIPCGAAILNLTIALCNLPTSVAESSTLLW